MISRAYGDPATNTAKSTDKNAISQISAAVHITVSPEEDATTSRQHGAAESYAPLEQGPLQESWLPGTDTRQIRRGKRSISL